MRVKIVFITLGMLALGGCATREANYRAPTADEMRVPYVDTGPAAKALPRPIPVRCRGTVECGQAWVRAQDVVQSVSMMRLRLVTDSRLETFAAMRLGQMTGTVVKFPIAADEFELQATFECPRNAQCGDLERRATDLFNSLLGSTQAGSAPPR